VKDSFGVDVAPGDYILSASTSGGWAKIGTVYAVPSSGRLMMTVEHGNSGRSYYSQSRSQIGSMSTVLRKADGTVPAHIGGEGDRLVIDGKSHEVLETDLQDIDEDALGYYAWVARKPEGESE
jgi:hypothetical protein